MKNRSLSFGWGALCEILTVVFVILKLTKTIDWGWLWVLAPLWIGTILALVFWLIIYLTFRHLL